MLSLRPRRSLLVGVVALALIGAVALAGSAFGPQPSPAGEALAARQPGPSGADVATGAGAPASTTSTASPVAAAATTPPSPGPTIRPIAPAYPSSSPGSAPIGPAATPPAGSFFRFDPRRPSASQSAGWLALKQSGRIVLRSGTVAVLAAVPLASGAGSVPVVAARTLDTSWTGRIVEPPGNGRDAAGTAYTDLSYWNLCGPGAAAVALYYWQQLTGRPDVSGTSGVFVEPYGPAGAWPARGPTFGGGRLGTYWSASDTVDGYRANGRGYLMYLAMAARPPSWSEPGLDTFTTPDRGTYYPTRGSSRDGIMTVLNWEASGHRAASWQETFYTSVAKTDTSLAADLHEAVQLDVGRDGVPVVAAIDTFELPNWQAARGGVTPHTRHAIAVVGYDDGASPPTYTYLDTCGRSCNPRPNSTNGGSHVLAQAQLVRAIQDSAGSGFVW